MIQSHHIICGRCSRCGVIAWACTAANGTGSMVFNDHVTDANISRMNSEIYRAILSAQIQPYVAKLDGASQYR